MKSERNQTTLHLEDEEQQEQACCCCCCPLWRWLKKLWRRRGQRRPAARVEPPRQDAELQPDSATPRPDEGDSLQLVPGGPQKAAGEDVGGHSTPALPEAEQVQEQAAPEQPVEAGEGDGDAPVPEGPLPQGEGEEAGSGPQQPLPAEEDGGHMPAPAEGAPAPPPAPAAPAKPRREDVLCLTVALTPGQLRLVLGPKGEALDELLEQYSGVRLGVLPQQGVRLRGPHSEVQAVARHIRVRLAQAEAERHRARRARKGHVKVTLPVPPNRRRHVLGPAGETLRAILQDYRDVRVTVPRPKDEDTAGITILGPEEQVAAVSAAISRHLQQVEATLLQAKQAVDVRKAKKETVREMVPVAPSRRECLLRPGFMQHLQKQYGDVQVRVPLPKDRNSCHVTLQGPREQVTAATALVNRRLQEEDQRLKECKATLEQARAAKAARQKGKKTKGKAKKG